MSSHFSDEISLRRSLPTLSILAANSSRELVRSSSPRFPTFVLLDQCSDARSRRLQIPTLEKIATMDELIERTRLWKEHLRVLDRVKLDPMVSGEYRFVSSVHLWIRITLSFS